jgi:hypothetical protein
MKLQEVGENRIMRSFITCTLFRITVFVLLPSSGILRTIKHDVSETGSVSVLRCGGGRHQIQFPKRRIFYFVEYRTMEKDQQPSNSECDTPSPEPFRTYSYYFINKVRVIK